MTFSKVNNGYNPQEVDEKIKEYLDEIENLRCMLQKAAATVESARDDLDLAKNRYTALSEELALKEKTASEINRIALKEANQVIEIANQNADLIVRQATSVARELLIEVKRISQETFEIKEDMLGQAKEIYEVIESLNIPIIKE